MKKDVVFRGCTRQPMIFGVPYIPFVVGAGFPLLLSMYLTLYMLLLIPVSILVMRMMAKRDEMIFRLIGLNLIFRFLPRNRQLHGGAWVFGSSKYSKQGRAELGYD
ncbi:MAG TPA: VirB3 family type IV secretion system protein [Hydrogenophaga sp.]